MFGVNILLMYIDINFCVVCWLHLGICNVTLRRLLQILKIVISNLIQSSKISSSHITE